LIAAAHAPASWYVVKLRASSRLLAPSRRHADHESVAAKGSGFVHQSPGHEMRDPIDADTITNLRSPTGPPAHRRVDHSDRLRSRSLGAYR
jgi:hypothetical protein